MTKAEIEARIESANPNWLADQRNRSTFNCYTCRNGHRMYTREVDPGCTPFMVACRHDGCDEHAQSCFYSLPPQRTPRVVSHEWYRPESTDGLSRLDEEFVIKGGLFLRKRGSTERLE